MVQLSNSVLQVLNGFQKVYSVEGHVGRDVLVRHSDTDAEQLKVEDIVIQVFPRFPRGMRVTVDMKGFSGLTQNHSKFYQWKELERMGPQKVIESTVEKTHELLKREEKKQNPSLWKKIR